MDYDLIVIGAGWAGFNSALKAKELGLKVAVVENRDVGGTCLNRGCIPTKTLIQSAKVFSILKKSKNFGIDVNHPKVNISEIISRKNKIVQSLRQGISFMLKGVDIIPGEAKFVGSNIISVSGKEIIANSIIIATGSQPFELPGFEFDGKKIISSNEILDIQEIPNSLLIIGAGVMGCEFASLFVNLGSSVTIVEKLPQLLPGQDKEVARKLEAIFKKKGINVMTGIDASGLDLSEFDLVLVSVGRKPNIDNLGLENIGIEVEKGKIKINDYLRTNIPNIYAVGDCTGRIMLAHYAAYQGKIAIENIVAVKDYKKANSTAVPNCIFTDPEIASVGLNEDEALQKGLKIVVSKFDFLASGMARIMDEAEGFIKIVSDKDSGLIVGASIIGPKATELIAVLTISITNSLKMSQVKETIFAHPTLSEAIEQVK